MNNELGRALHAHRLRRVVHGQCGSRVADQRRDDIAGPGAVGSAILLAAPQAQRRAVDRFLTERAKALPLKGPVIRKGASIGANTVILPGVEIGEGSMISAGAVVTKDIPSWKLAIGSPAKIVELSEELRVFNNI